MGWQDAPLASPSGPQPAWASAPVAPAPSADAPGFLSRVRARVQQSVGSLAGGIDQAVHDTVGAVIPGVADWTKRDQQTSADPTVQQAEHVLAQPGGVDFKTVKEDPSLGNIARYAGETALGAIPDVTLGAAALPLYAVGIEGRTARERAQNDKRADPGILDYLAAAPSAAANVALQKFGVGGKGVGLLQRVGREAAAQGGISGADYAGTTIGTQTPFSPAEALNRVEEGAATGVALGGGMHLTSHGITALRGRYAANGVDTSAIPDDQLVEGSLNGSIHQGVGPADVADILKSQGVPPESVSPDKAATFAERIQAARARPNTNDLGAKEVIRQNGINEDIAAGETHPAWASAPIARTPAPDVTMTAAPEGIIPSDDTGAQAGLDRHRAAVENVLATAQQHAERDPVIKEVLDSSLSPDTKVGVLLDRLHKYVGSLPTPEIPTEPNVDQAPTPFQEPTAEAARSHVIDHAAQAQLPMDVVQGLRAQGIPEHIARGAAAGVQAESRGDHTAVDPASGAFGIGQWLGARKQALMDRYGPNPSRQQQIEFLAHELKGGDSGGKFVMGAADEAGALDAYITKFMRPAAGKETEGDLSRGQQALGVTPRETVYRGPAPTEDAFRSDSGFERTDAPEEPLERTGLGESRTATGDSSSPFMEETDTPAGEEPGFWERRAEMQADDLRKEWEASKQEPPPAGADPSQKYGANNYGQRPHMPEGADTWATTPEGHIANLNGKPVAFRNVKDAARFAAKNKLGGDFEPQVWTTNSARVVLTRREGSTYGERGPRPDAEAGPAEPAAGRTGDTSQRLLSDAERPPQAPENVPPARDTAPEAPTPPEVPSSAPAPVSGAAEAPPLAERGSVSDQTVPRGTENIPEKEAPEPRNFFQAVRDHLADKQAKSGVRTHLSAEDAISNGVQPDSIYIDPKAKYPRLKIWASKVFANAKGPLLTRAKPTKIVSLDYLGDRMNPEQFGVQPGDGVQDHRLAPEDAGALLQQSIDRDPEAHDRLDDRYEPYHEQIRRGEDQDRQDIERDALHEIAARHGFKLSDDEVEAALHHRAAGETHEYAVEAAVWESAARALDRSADESGDEFYRSVAHGVHEGPIAEENGGRTAESVERSEGERTNADRGSEGSEEPRDAELVPGRENDQRDALQRRADEGLKPGTEQKPAGSDGGLFDIRDTTGGLFDGKKPGYGDSNKFVTREDKERASAKISAASKRANSGVDPEAVGALGTEAAFHVEASARKLASMLLEPDAHPAEIIHAVRDMVKSPKKTTKGLLKSLDRFGSAYAYSADGALRTLARHYNAPTLTTIADMFQARRGAADSTDRTYDEAVHRQIGRFVNERLMSSLDPFIGKAGSLERIRDLLAEPGRSQRATPAEHAAAKEVRKLLDDVIAYRREAGEDIVEVKNYFPRVLDALSVAKDTNGFIKAATKLYQAVDAENPEQAAQDWMQRVLDTDAGINGGEEFVRASGKPASAKSREFGPAADRLLRDYYQKDASLVLHDYIMGSVRRAEQARRFGPKGAVGSKERGAWMKEHGTKSQWDVMLDNIRDELRASGEGAANVPARVREIVDGNLGRLIAIGAKTSAAVAGLHAWNQLAHLERVTFASLGDAAMGYTRFGGKIGTQHLIGTVKEAVRLIETLGKRDPSDKRRWAEAFGVVGHGNASALIRSRLDQNPSLPQHAGFLDKFYRKVGLEQWTQGGRAQSADGAKVFLDTLAHDLMSGSARTRQRAGFYLKEAGVKDPQAFGEWLRNAPSRTELMSDKGHAAQYATAIIRMSNDTVLMPNRAQKPTWASHPVGSLLFALQSYNAAFTQNVLKRVGRLGIEAVKQKDAKLLGPAAGLIPLIAVTAAQNYMRTAIFGGKQDDDLTSYALTILDRAGLTGMASPIFNAFGGLRYHRSTGSALEGSILGSATQAADAIGGLFLQNSGNTNTAERKVAGLVYDLVVNPTENLVGAKYVRGAAGTAVIMGTGNRKGGVLPADRDAFIDAVAGPQKQKGG